MPGNSNSGGPRQKGALSSKGPLRSDLNQPKAAPVGQEYGQRKQTMDAQGVTALPNMAARSAATGQGGLDTRGQIPSLSDPSARPGEPVTAGLPGGPGPGPEALMNGPYQTPEELWVLRAIYSKYPNEDLRRMIEWQEANL